MSPPCCLGNYEYIKFIVLSNPLLIYFRCLLNYFMTEAVGDGGSGAAVSNAAAAASQEEPNGAAAKQRE